MKVKKEESSRDPYLLSDVELLLDLMSEIFGFTQRCFDIHNVKKTLNRRPNNVTCIRT